MTIETPSLAPTLIAKDYVPGEARAARTTARGFLAWFAVTFTMSFALVWIYVAAMPMACG